MITRHLQPTPAHHERFIKRHVFAFLTKLSLSLSHFLPLSFSDGLMKMKGVYEANSAMGDPNSVEGQLQENAHRMDKLQKELRKFNDYLAEVDSNGMLKPGTPRVHKKHSHRNSVSESDSLSRSASDSSVRDSNPLPGTTVIKQNGTNGPTANGGSSDSNSTRDSIGSNHVQTSTPKANSSLFKHVTKNHSSPLKTNSAANSQDVSPLRRSPVPDIEIIKSPNNG